MASCKNVNANKLHGSENKRKGKTEKKRQIENENNSQTKPNRTKRIFMYIKFDVNV